MVSYNMYGAKSNVQGYVEAIGETTQSRCMRHITSESPNLCIELQEWAVCYNIDFSESITISTHLVAFK